MSKMTQQGYEQLKQELERLEEKDRPAIAKMLKEAIAQGDLSENFAYHDAKDRQADIEERIGFLKEEIKNAVVETLLSTDTVTVGSTVILESQDKKQQTYIITGKEEADPTQRKISYDSPIGESLLNKKQGEVVTVQTPAGERTYTIVEIQ